jgi:V8-like Glu-specific endopeptidase
LRAGNGNHYCAASVVTSPDRDLLITAAHCINGGGGGGYRSDVVFIPDYRDGRAPYGIWTPARLVVAGGWVRSAAPDLDVGFVVLKPRDGTSGSPWVTDFNPATRTGRVVGVIGGYQQGGDTAAVSYSAYFGTAISQLYHEAISP